MADPPLSAGELMRRAEELYTSFSPALVTVDTHADEFLREWRVTSESDATFLRQVSRCFATPAPARVGGDNTYPSSTSPAPEPRFFARASPRTHQVFYGCVRYRRLLGVLLAAFYSRNSSTAGRDDADRYALFGYLILLRLDELSFPQFR